MKRFGLILVVSLALLFGAQPARAQQSIDASAIHSDGDLAITADALMPTEAGTAVGSLTQKWGPLYASELWVETLVAQDTMATIGGRVLVAPTTTLIEDVDDDDTTIHVKHNNLASGDRIVLESGGSLEWMAVTSSASGSAGDYSYSVTRNLDGSGANTWSSGDAVLSTGASGDGFIDLYSDAGVIPGDTVGPSIVGNVRTGSTWDAVSPRWALGNLDGLYGYDSTIYGAAFGDPSGAWLKIDATNGLRIGYGANDPDIALDASGGTIADWSINNASLTSTGVGLYSDHLVSKARSFNGSSSVLARAFTSGTVDNWTIGAWANANTTGAQRFILNVGSGANGYGLLETTDGHWNGVISAVTTVGGSASSVTTGAWTFIALRRMGGTTQLFVNGSAVGSSTSGTPSNPSGDISIGARLNSGGTAFEQFFNGAIAHVFIVHAALTSAQIAAIAAGGPEGHGLAAHLVDTGDYAGQSPLYEYYPLIGSGASEELWQISGGALSATNAPSTDGPTIAMEAARVEVGSGSDAAGASAAYGGADDIALWAGATYANRATAPFRVTADGSVTMTDATITGDGSGLTNINGGHITAGTVTATQLGADSVTSAKIVAGTIVASDIASSTITADRMNVSSLSAITANLGTVTAGTISGVTITGGTITAGSGSEVFLSSDGITIEDGTSDRNAVKWGDGSSKIWGTSTDLSILADNEIVIGCCGIAVTVDRAHSSVNIDGSIFNGALGGSGTRHVCAESTGKIVVCP